VLSVLLMNKVRVIASNNDLNLTSTSYQIYHIINVDFKNLYAVEDGHHSFTLSLDTKYYTSEVIFEVQSSMSSSPSSDYQATIVFIDSVDTMNDLMLIENECETKIVCMNEKDVSDEYRLLALSNGYEMVVIASVEDCNHDDIDMRGREGLCRIHEALEATEWPSMTMKEYTDFQSYFIATMI